MLVSRLILVVELIVVLVLGFERVVVGEELVNSGQVVVVFVCFGSEVELFVLI